MKTKQPFIFTEAYGCGLILKKCLQSFFKYHPDIKVNVFGTFKDFKDIGKFKNVEYFELSDDLELKECFKNGHLGTAHIGTRVIKEFSKDSDYIIHFDSDIVFKKESLSLIFEKIEEGYDIIGPRRCYKHNRNGKTNLDHLPDVSQTYFFAFNKNKIDSFTFDVLRQMVVGYYSPTQDPILDYFDPVSFNILSNGGKIYFLNPDFVGGLTETGGRNNKYGELNEDLDFGDNLVHFAGIGSGMKFYFNGADNAHKSYVDWALKRFGVYYKIFFNKSLENVEFDEKSYNLLKNNIHETDYQ